MDVIIDRLGRAGNQHQASRRNAGFLGLGWGKRFQEGAGSEPLSSPDCRTSRRKGPAK